jgi:hypothetical protein
VALKTPDVAAAAIVTDAGTVSAELVLVRMTVAPPAGAGWVRVTVQAPEELAPRLAGQCRETSTGATRLMVALATLMLLLGREAVIVAV